MDKTNVSNFLLSLIGKQIIYCPNPGNAGDSIIAHATYQLFKQLQLQYQEVSPDVSPEITAGKVVIYGGGGNLVEPYPNARDFIQKHHQLADTLIILPHTILSYPALLGELKSNAHIFCRELESFAYVSKLAKQAHVYLADDMALAMNTQQTMAIGAQRFWPVLSGKTLIVRNIKRVIRKALHCLKNTSQPKTLYAFRDDVEKTSIPIPAANIDISQAFSADGMSEYLCHETAYRVLNFIQQFDDVYTNRLHICISALLLGKKVYFYDNSYGKNRYVYECSFKDRFPNIVWMGTAVTLNSH